MVRKRSVSACLAVLIAVGGFVVTPQATHAQATGETAPISAYFDKNSDEIFPIAAAILDAAAAEFASSGSGAVYLSGHTDGAESVDPDPASDDAVGLSQRRASNVRAYLVARGVPDGVMLTQAYGASRPALDGASSPQNRRVEIIFGPGSGW